MSTITSNINNISNYNDDSLPMLGMKFYDTYGVPLNVKSGPFDFNDLKKYFHILINNIAFLNASNEEIDEIKQYIRKVTGLQFDKMRLVLNQFSSSIPNLLRPYCERGRDGTSCIVVLVFFNNGQVALITFDRNLTCDGQDMFRAFIFNNNAVQKSIDAHDAVVVARVETQRSEDQRMAELAVEYSRSPAGRAATARMAAESAAKRASNSLAEATMLSKAAERAAERAAVAAADTANSPEYAERKTYHAENAACSAALVAKRAATELAVAKRLAEEACIAEAAAERAAINAIMF